MTAYRTLTIAAALIFSALGAQADTAPSGDGDGSNRPLTATEAPGALTREVVIADLVASRKAGTLPRDGDWYNAPAPLGATSSGGWLPGAIPTATSNALDRGNQ